MSNVIPWVSFRPGEPDVAGIVSWIHIGDLHMTRAGEQNDLDLQAIVQEINQVFSSSVSFVYLPGDTADNGRADEYRVVRRSLDQLKSPWCSIIGDHDVHEQSFDNYLASMTNARYYSFAVGNVRFVALNAFDIADPRSFCVQQEQLEWFEELLNKANAEKQAVVLFLHCYPSDLKRGGERLQRLVQNSAVRLVEMGHTHYNELANDGRTLYAATRSTGQIEEGPVGFSITNIDGEVVSWRFVELNQLPVVMITSPADERFITDPVLEGYIAEDRMIVRAKVFAETAVTSVVATLEGCTSDMSLLPGSCVWQVEVECSSLVNGVHTLEVVAVDQHLGRAEDSIRVVKGTSAYVAPPRRQRDQENAVGAWTERGLLGTQLGPNKNGRKW